MKQAVILHGTDGTPDSNWFPWLKAKLEAIGYKIWVPELPNNHAPNRVVYDDFLLDSDWDFSDNIVIGHSSGAVSVLNLLMDERCPKIKLGIMVSAWASMAMPVAYQKRSQAVGLQPEQFDHLFPDDGFDFDLIQSKAERLALIHSSDDPFCPLEQAQYLAQKLGAPLTTVQNGKHLGSNYLELPEVWEIIGA